MFTSDVHPFFASVYFASLLTRVWGRNSMCGATNKQAAAGNVSCECYTLCLVHDLVREQDSVLVLPHSLPHPRAAIICNVINYQWD